MPVPILTRVTESPRAVYHDEHLQFRDTVAAFIDNVVAPNFDRWESQKAVDRSLFAAAGKQGMLLFATPEAYGGPGVDDFRFNAIVNEEFGRSGYASAGLSLALQNDVVGPYITDLTTDEQKHRWLPGLTSGVLVGAIAMTEPSQPSPGAAVAGDNCGGRRRRISAPNAGIRNAARGFR